MQWEDLPYERREEITIAMGEAAYLGECPDWLTLIDEEEVQGCPATDRMVRASAEVREGDEVWWCEMLLPNRAGRAPLLIEWSPAFDDSEVPR